MFSVVLFLLAWFEPVSGSKQSSHVSFGTLEACLALSNFDSKVESAPSPTFEIPAPCHLSLTLPLYHFSH